MAGLGRFMVNLGQFGSVWVGSWSALGLFHGQFGSVLGRFMVDFESV